MEKFESIKKEIDPKKLLVFDLDGTLVDLGIDWISLKKDLEDYCFKMKKVKVSFVKLGFGLSYVKEKYDEEFYNEIIKIIGIYESNYKNYKLNKEIIDYINNSKNKIAIYSMNTSICINKFIKKYLINKPVFVISKDNSIESKPTDKDLLLMAKHLKTQKKDIIFIGNTEEDLLSGKYAGIKTFLVTF